MVNYLEAHSLDADQKGSNIAQFAMSIIATTTLSNQEVLNSSPTLPVFGYSPKIKWHYVIALFAGIGAVRNFFVRLLCWIARPVIATVGLGVSDFAYRIFV